MKNLFLFTIIILITNSCGTMRNINSVSKIITDYGSPNVKQKLLDDNTFIVNEYSTDNSYGYTSEKPVMVGGEDSGPKNERRFLNALTGPNGEEIEYSRLGSCCSFRTENSDFGGGMLDRYAIHYEGLMKQLVIYINMYDSDTLKVPIGLELRK